ncbi:MAG: hypothetical protein RL026_2189, partial [Pseudomonadota bacterium]
MNGPAISKNTGPGLKPFAGFCITRRVVESNGTNVASVSNA